MRVSAHWVGQSNPLTSAPNFLISFAASQCVTAIMGTLTFISVIWRPSVAAPLECPETTRRSAFKALAFRRVGVISLKSLGSLSSITIFNPCFLTSSITPARISRENGSFSNAMATLTSPGDFPFFLLITAASPIELARYCSEVESTANRYL